MPLYVYQCGACDAVEDHQVPIADRLMPQNCAFCGGEGTAQLAIAPVSFGTERKRGEARIITDERQVDSELGKDWRDQGTNRNPGGAGSRTYIHD
jgi:putative FmdB family regulatory protein